ncbi:MAG: inositol monophosphatase family protein [Limimaricola soesokkakensis]|uniref:inositol monophosphatase family protein n=1 Tax=Limimaricola soesokkakensis TaxID=1343159 RepID=UPI00405A3242
MIDNAELAKILKAAARAEILPRFRRLGAGDIATKSGPDDLVTEADTRAEIHISAALRDLLPGALIVGEESVSEDATLLDGLGTAELSAIIDPVDGTWNFARGLALFGMILALGERGRVTHGLLYDPLLDDRIEAHEDGPCELVTSDGGRRVLSTSEISDPARMNLYVPLALLPADRQHAVAAAFPGFGRVTSLRCSCHEYRLIAQGHAEAALAAVLNPWDHAAGALAVTRAGGVARMLDGRNYHLGLPRDAGYLLTASSEAAWEAVAARLGPALL